MFLHAHQPEIHGKPYFDAILPHPDAYTYIPFDPIPTLEDFCEWVETRIRKDPSLVLFAMLDKTKNVAKEEDAIAGIIGLLNTIPRDRSTEIGLLFTLPAFQRTHVTANAVGLLMDWCFDELEMRRVQWRSDPENFASIRVAERMGFRTEMVRKWDKVLPPGKEGIWPRKEDVLAKCAGVHTVYLAICWDDWEEWKAKAHAVMDRR